MALSRFLEGLTDYISNLDVEKQERIAKSLVRRAINEDLGLDTTYDIFVKRGFSIEKDRFSDIYTNTQQRELNSQRVKYISRTQTPTEDILYPSFTLKDRRYKFVFEYDLFDETDEQLHTKFVSIETDRLITRRELEEKALDIIIHESDKNPDYVENVRLRYGEINVRSIR